MQHEKEVCQYAKSFFGITSEDGEILIVVPHVERTRPPSFHCDNYPIFDYEISPDDAFSTFRILCLLTAIHGMRKNITLVSSEEYHHREVDTIFIGGPPTNSHIHSLTQKGPLKFGENNEVRSIHGTKNIYWIEFDEHPETQTTQPTVNSLSIRQDYCLIAKNTVSNHVQFVIGGLRAYGQRAVYDFLNDCSFYRAIEGLFGYPFFRILVGVRVDGRTIATPWDIVETNWANEEGKWQTHNSRLSIFLSYVTEDWEHRVRFLERRLRQEYFDVFVAPRDIDPAQDFRKVLETEIERRDVVVVCFSRNYLRKRNPYVDVELQTAMKLNKCIVPVRFERCAIHNPAVVGLEWCDLFGDWGREMSQWTEEDWKREKSLQGLIRVLYEKQLEKK